MAPTPTGPIPMLERDQVGPEVAALYDALLAQRGVVPTMQKTLAHVPDVLLGLTAHLKALMGDGALPALLKELVAVRVAVLRGCHYCLASHTAQAKMRGASQAQVDGCWDPAAGPFTPAERVALRVADEVHGLAHALPEATWRDLKSHFSDPQIIELVTVAATFQFTTRMVEGLGIPVTMLAGSQLEPSTRG